MTSTAVGKSRKRRKRKWRREKEKGWGGDVGNVGRMHGGDLVPLVSIPEPVSAAGEVEPACRVGRALPLRSLEAL